MFKRPTSVPHALHHCKEPKVKFAQRGPFITLRTFSPPPFLPAPKKEFFCDSVFHCIFLFSSASHLIIKQFEETRMLIQLGPAGKKVNKAEKEEQSFQQNSRGRREKGGWNSR